MQLKNKILEFLNRNLVLDKEIIVEIRESIDDLSEEKLKWIFEVLQDLDNKQTSVLQEKLKENPFFFFEMENEVFKEMYQKHITEEKKEREMVEKWLKEKLDYV